MTSEHVNFIKEHFIATRNPLGIRKYPTFIDLKKCQTLAV